MKYTIEGFSQEYVSTLRDEKNRIDCTDLVILRWFVDFQATGRMEFVDIGRDRFFWVNYKALLDDMPILSISKRALYDRLQKMVKFGLLKHHHHKTGGNFSYYCTGPNYSNLLASPYEENFATFGSKLPNLMKQTSEPFGSKLPNKDPSTTDPSSKYEEKRKRFIPPSVDEVRAYCQERKNRIDPEAFVDYYTANGWVQGKGKPIKDWKATVRTWESREKKKRQDDGPERLITSEYARRSLERAQREAEMRRMEGGQ